MAAKAYEVERICGKRIARNEKDQPMKTNSGEDEYEYEVKWVGYPKSQNTWEPLSSLTKSLWSIHQYERRMKEEEEAKAMKVERRKVITTTRKRKAPGTNAIQAKTSRAPPTARREPTTFLDLPNELLVNAFEELCKEDRKALASVHPRLKSIANMAGKRCFNIIRVINEPAPYASSSYYDILSEKLKNLPLNFHAAIFNNASANSLQIEIDLYPEMIKKLVIVFMTLKVNNLVINFNSDIAGRCINEFLYNCKLTCNKVWIRSNAVGAESGKDILMSLPNTKGYVIDNFLNTVQIDDDILLSLVNNSSYTEIKGTCTTHVTARALATVFEIVRCSKKAKEVQLSVRIKAIDDLFRELDLEQEDSGHIVKESVSIHYQLQKTVLKDSYLLSMISQSS